ncbi:Ankyrin repeat-containing domain protein [Niveomyces insectorum RCEF 264]|uniref:Ankyrin repeat-containing domain protein n=1 Tax=Niveomyces insectorum RCEF 264 TaxID=1081102 RepID=A0A167VM04_9HYPO|nr:Ankyrin repeat-containing domain protein [Niveomyces insectorum RCEF 264]
MDAAASVIAVIQITERVVVLSYRYLKAAKNAKADIERLQSELGSLNAVLKGAQELLDGPHGATLKTSQRLHEALKGCDATVKELETKLAERADKVRRRVLGFGTLKWPFDSHEVDRIVQTLHTHRDTLNAGLSIDQTQIENDKRLEILDWISSIQYGKHHDTVRDARTPNTCEWLLQDHRFRQWEDAASSTLLWLQGSPGAGKTFLTSKVIDHVQGRLESSPNNREGFAFFYCNRNEEERRKPLSVLQSFARQLSTAVGHPLEIQKNLRALWHKSRVEGRDLGFEACTKQLLESVNLYERTTLVLDAMDECDPDVRLRLTGAIELLLSSTKRPLRATDNKDDIRTYVDQEIVKHRRWNKIPLQLREEIVQTILDRSDGMFQWAFLQIKQLLELQTEAALRSRLGRLPKGLQAAYDEIYGKIATGNEHEKILADRAFLWVMCARKPLTSDELLSAVRLDPAVITHLSEAVDEDILLSLCNNLLVLDGRQRVWRFSHLSVTEYFEENHWRLWQAHGHVAKVCLALLLETHKDAETATTVGGSGHDGNGQCGIFDPKHSLQNYVRRHWIFHVQQQEGQKVERALVDLLMAFLGSPEKSSSQYQRWYAFVMAGYEDIGLLEVDPPTCSMLLMCRFSLFTVLPDWWHNEELPLSQTNVFGDSLLTIASSGGCRAICEALLDRGMQVNLQSGRYGSALAAAASMGHNEVVQFLVEQGAADVNLQVQSKNHGSALIAAVAEGHEATARYLVKQGRR